MVKALLLIFWVCLIAVDSKSAVNLLEDMYYDCIQNFSVECVKLRALHWADDVADRNEIMITEDLAIVKKNNPDEREVSRSLPGDVFENFENFLQTHDLLVKVPQALNPEGPLRELIPRSFQPEDIKLPLAATGRSSKIVKKVIVPFLLGLKFKTAVLVPLALALIALKTWKALTLGLLSLVLTGALVIFKFTKPKVNYEVIHYPHHADHHVDHHVDHPPVSGWEHPGYGRELNGNELAYNAYK